MPRRLLTVLIRCLVIGGLAYAFSAVPGVRPRAGYDRWLDGWLNNGLIIGSAVLCFARVWLVRSERGVWFSIGLGTLAYALGSIYYYTVVVFQDPQPYPSWADVGWLTVLPCSYLAAVLLVRRHLRSFHRTLWLDGVVGALGAAGLAVGVVFPGVLRLAGGQVPLVVLNLIYPAGDLLLLVLAVGVFALFGWRPPPVWRVLAAGWLLLAVSDVVYLGQSATGSYRPGSLVDAGWAVAMVMLGLAAWQVPRPSAALRLDGWAVLGLPSLFAATALALLVYGCLVSLPVIAVAFAGATLAAALVRTGFTVTEFARLRAGAEQARTDDLTGLANRRHFYEAAAERLEGRSDEVRAAVLVIDLNGFKDVNDSLGHHRGDELLKSLAPRWLAELRPEDLLARMGGDEFVVLLPGADAAQAAAVAHRLRDQLRRPFLLGGVSLHVDASVGVAACPDHGRNTDELLRHADVAMYQAKTLRSGVELYRVDRDPNSRGRLELMQALRGSLEPTGDTDEGALLVHYQPKLDLRSGQVVGVEALVRWRHPGLGLVQPDDFLPQAERAGLMRPVTLQVLDMALAQCRAWWQLERRLSVSVNLSAANLVDLELPAAVQAHLVAHGLPASALLVEVTEGSLIEDRGRCLQVLHALRALGVRVSIDDFGTGYSSLSYLLDLPVDELKLDRSFTWRMSQDRRSRAIVESAVRFAHALGLPLVAEGVQTATELALLTDLGCDQAQGYHLGCPQPAAALDLAPRDLRPPAAVGAGQVLASTAAGAGGPQHLRLLTDPGPRG
ncbi:MAG: EAL domain-containing protein [Frankiaceae bacterium]